MSKRKRAQQSKKKQENKNFLLTKSHKLTSFFQVVEKEAGHSSDDLHSNSPPISSQSDIAQDKIFSCDDDNDDIE